MPWNKTLDCNNKRWTILEHCFFVLFKVLHRFKLPLWYTSVVLSYKIWYFLWKLVCFFSKKVNGYTFCLEQVEIDLDTQKCRQFMMKSLSVLTLSLTFGSFLCWKSSFSISHLFFLKILCPRQNINCKVVSFWNGFCYLMCNSWNWNKPLKDFWHFSLSGKCILFDFLPLNLNLRRLLWLWEFLFCWKYNTGKEESHYFILGEKIFIRCQDLLFLKGIIHVCQIKHKGFENWTVGILIWYKSRVDIKI